MDMENGDQVTKWGYLCPQDSRGGGVSNPNNPPYLRHWSVQISVDRRMILGKSFG